MAVKAIPEGYHTVTAYLIVAGAAEALEFYKKAFGAEEVMRMAGPDGKVGHAEIRIGDSRVMLADEHPAMGAKGPRAFGGSPVSLMIYVKDVDTQVKKAVGAGAKLVRPVDDRFYGDRNGTLEDPFGHSWTIATHIEDVSMEEINRRAAKMMGG
jgi:PhnB protein